ncbi:DivIVA domain-containing protein, partial [Lactobacillus sp. XV13L]|nr:DivIVA domain-containing protein [Lactobacillus sp. XV13L]
MDIHNKKFRMRYFNGYDRYEVDNFLDQIGNDYGDALDETADLKNENLTLNEQLKDLQAQLN